MMPRRGPATVRVVLGDGSPALVAWHARMGFVQIKFMFIKYEQVK